jgi:hypothetical protein
MGLPLSVARIISIAADCNPDLLSTDELHIRRDLLKATGLVEESLV